MERVILRVHIPLLLWTQTVLNWSWFSFTAFENHSLWYSTVKILLNESKMCVLCSVMCNSLRPHGLWPTRLLCPWNSLSKNTGVGCHALLQEIFQSRDQTHVSCISCATDRFFTSEPPEKPLNAKCKAQMLFLISLFTMRRPIEEGWHLFCEVGTIIWH